MVNKTIKDRGLTTTTRQVPWDFSFDKITRQLELIYYYQYCASNDLITVSGEQSRTALILKTYNKKSLDEYEGGGGFGSEAFSQNGYSTSGFGGGGYGYLGYSETAYNEVILNNNVGQRTLWSDAMRDWLQITIPSGETDLNELWIQYFEKYSTVPDSASITYAGLSVEDAYRKFIIKNISGNVDLEPIFSDQFALGETIKFKLKKFFNDTTSLDDAALIIMRHIRSFSDDFTLNDGLIFGQKKFFDDTVTMLDDFIMRLGKGFHDTFTLEDLSSFVRNIRRSFSDPVSLTEGLKFIYTPRFADALTLDDALQLIYKSTYDDDVTLDDSLDSLMYIYRYEDPVFLTDDNITFVLT